MISSRFIVFLILLLHVSADSAWSDVFYVPNDYLTIQDGIDNIAQGDTLILEADTYAESIYISDQSITLASRYILDGDSSHIYNTVLSPDPGTRALLIESTDNYHVILQGLSFMGAQLPQELGNDGAAIQASNITLSIMDCGFIDNHAYYDGGALKLNNCSVSILHSHFEGNTAQLAGGAIRADNCDIHIADSNFFQNANQYYAGAAFINDSSVRIENNYFVGNFGAVGAGAVYVSSSDVHTLHVEVVSNVFQSNRSEVGASLYTFEVDTISIHSNRFSNNLAEGIGYPMGAAMYIGPGSTSAEIANNEFYYNRSDRTGSAAVLASAVRFHDNLIFRNEGNIYYAITTQHVNDNDGMTAHIFHNLFFRNIPRDRNYEHDYGAVGAGFLTNANAYENDFYGNNPLAAGEHPSFAGTLFADNNYWGDPTGPYHPTQNPQGRGDHVMDEIDILPFSDAPFTTRWLHAPEPFALIEPADGQPLPVGEPVTFRWAAAADSTPTDTLRYTLELADNPDFTDLVEVNAGTDTSVTVDAFDLEQSYHWRVSAQDIYDLSTLSSETRQFLLTNVPDSDLGTRPTVFALEAAWPNPFNPGTSVTVTMPNAADLTVAVYNALGQQVMELAHGSFAAGNHTFEIDGRRLASGIYFVQATVPGELHEIQKIVLMK